jgi:hypothetical protein
MNAFTNDEIFDGLITNNSAITNFILDQMYEKVENYVSLWYGGEVNKKKGVELYMFDRLNKIKRKCRYNQASNGISMSEVTAFFTENFYDNFYQIKDVFNRLLRMGKSIAIKSFRLNPAEKESIIEDITIESLAAFYLQYVRLFPEDRDKCNLNRYFKILHNKTITLINKQYKTTKVIKNPDIEEVNEAIIKYFLNEESGEFPESIEDLINKTKEYRLTEQINDLIKNDYKIFDDYEVNQIYKDEDFSYLLEIFRDVLNENDIELILKYDEELVNYMMLKNIGQKCIQILLLIYYGFDHDEIREKITNENGEKYTKDGFKVKVNRCRNRIKEYWEDFRR